MILTIVVIVLVVLLAAGLLALSQSVRVLREYERGVVFRLGRLMEIRGPDWVAVDSRLGPGVCRCGRSACVSRLFRTAAVTTVTGMYLTIKNSAP